MWHYLAGLIESDGTIITPSNSKNRPTIKIVFHQKDKPLAEFLKIKLGYGTIQKTTSDLALELVIRNKIGILDLVHLINGKFRTPKIKNLNNLIDWINNNPYYNNLINNNSNSLQKLDLDVSPIINNAWLAGFSEGDCTFQIKITEPNNQNKYFHVATTYELTQTKIDPKLNEDFKPIMDIIAKNFLSKLGEVKLTKFDRSGKQNRVKS